jgi:hypothetical protein
VSVCPATWCGDVFCVCSASLTYVADCCFRLFCGFWTRWTHVAVRVFQIMFNLEKAHFILDEMVMNGYIVETNKISILKPIHLMEKAS